MLLGPNGKRKMIVVLILGAAVIVGLITLLFVPESRQGTVEDPNGNPAQTFGTPEITFGIPKDFGLATSEKSYIPLCDPDSDFDYCLYYIGNAYKGTNFEGAVVRIKRRADLVGSERCLTENPSGYQDLVPVVRDESEYATSVFSPLGDAAAGHSTRGELYRLQFGDTCYEFQTRVGQAQFANYEPGLIKEFTAENEREIMGSLRTIIRAITITEGAKHVFFPQIDD